MSFIKTLVVASILLFGFILALKGSKFVFVLGQYDNNGRFDEKCHTRQLDACSVGLGFVGNHSFKVPKDIRQMTNYCENLRESLNCIQRFARKCLSGLPRQALNSMMRLGKQHSAALCADDKHKSYFVDSLLCLEDSKLEQFYRCMDSSLARLEYISSKNVTTSAKFPVFCCSHHVFQHHIEKTMREICSGQSVQKQDNAIKLINDAILGTTGEFLQLVCGDYKTYQDCKKSAKVRDYVTELESVTSRVAKGLLKPSNSSLSTLTLQIFAQTTS